MACANGIGRITAHDDVAFTVGIDTNVGRPRDIRDRVLEVTQVLRDRNRVDQLAPLRLHQRRKARQNVADLLELGSSPTVPRTTIDWSKLKTSTFGAEIALRSICATSSSSWAVTVTS